MKVLHKLQTMWLRIYQNGILTTHIIQIYESVTHTCKFSDKLTTHTLQAHEGIKHS